MTFTLVVMVTALPADSFLALNPPHLTLGDKPTFATNSG
jgi:hypothetical protein